MKTSRRNWYRNCLISMLLLFFLFPHTAAAESIPRISVQEAHEKVTSGKALLVCAYSDESCQDVLLAGAILRSDFEMRLKSLPKEREVIFYCA